MFDEDIELNRFALAQDYKTMQPKQFLEMLKSLEPIQGIKGAVEYITRILSMIKQYAVYQTISFIKGIVIPFGNKDGKNVDYDWTKTADYETQIKGLWTVLDMDKGYFDPDVQSAYKELVEVLSKYGFDKETLDLARFDSSRGIFQLKINNNKINLSIMSKNVYDQFLKYAAMHLKEIPDNLAKAVPEMTRSGNIIVDADNETIKAFMVELALQKNVQKINEQKEEKPVSKETSKEPQQTLIDKPALSKWQNISLKGNKAAIQKQVKDQIFAYSPEDIAKTTVKVSVRIDNIKKDLYKGTDKIAISIPKGYHTKDGKFITTVDNENKNMIVLIPKEWTQMIDSQILNPNWHNPALSIEIPLNANDKIEQIDFDGNPVLNKNAKGENVPAYIKAIDLMRNIDIYSVRTDRNINKEQLKVQELKKWVSDVKNKRTLCEKDHLNETICEVNRFFIENGIDDNMTDDKWHELSQTIDTEQEYEKIKGICMNEVKAISEGKMLEPNKSQDKITIHTAKDLENVLSQYDHIQFMNKDKGYIVRKTNNIDEDSGIPYSICVLDKDGIPTEETVDMYDVKEVENYIGGIDQSLEVSAIGLKPLRESNNQEQKNQEKKQKKQRENIEIP